MKRSVRKLHTFCGIKRLEYLFKKAHSISDLHNGIAVTLFQTGCRVSELVTLSPTQYTSYDNYSMFSNVPVLKRGKKLVYRNIFMKKDEYNPFISDLDKNKKYFGLEKYIKKVKDQGLEFLFPSYIPFDRDKTPTKDKHCSRQHIYNKVIEIDKKIWPHWWRDMRARHLSKYRFKNIFDLQKWFEWKTVETATHYLGVRDRQVLEAMNLKPQHLDA